MHEPAGLRRRPMGISYFARLGWLRSRLNSGVGGGLVRDLSPGGRWIGNRPRLVFSAVALTLAMGTPGGIRGDEGIAA